MLGTYIIYSNMAIFWLFTVRSIDMPRDADIALLLEDVIWHINAVTFHISISTMVSSPIFHTYFVMPPKLSSHNFHFEIIIVPHYDTLSYSFSAILFTRIIRGFLSPFIMLHTILYIIYIRLIIILFISTNTFTDLRNIFIFIFSYFIYWVLHLYHFISSTYICHEFLYFLAPTLFLWDFHRIVSCS